jgi:serine/threonine-protein kinase SRPK3
MWESLRELSYRLPNGLFTEKILKGSLQQLFLALDYLHTECKLVHTGARALLSAMALEVQESNAVQTFLGIIEDLAKQILQILKQTIS